MENAYREIPVRGEAGPSQIPQNDALRLYEEGGNAYAQTEKEILPVREPLADLENDLNPTRFVRVSDSEILQIRRIKAFSVTLTGNIDIEFDCGLKIRTNRGCIKYIKAFLGL